MKNWELARRDLLKSLGVGVACLPILRATRSYAAVPTFGPRFACILLTEGYRPGLVAPPAGPLAAQALPMVTAPLEKHKQDLIIMANINNPQFRGCFKWGHGTYGTIFAQDRGDPNTGNGKEYWEPMNPTVDQVIAKSIKAPVAVPSIALSVRVGTNSGGTGSNRCFFTAMDQPITPENNPYNIFSMLFTGKPVGMPDPNADKLRVERKSLLDFVGNSLQKFANQLGTEDRTVIQGHLDSIRTLENELTAVRSSASCGDVMLSGNPAQPVADTNDNIPTLLSLNFQLMTAAFKCDASRVVTLQFGDATGGDVTFPVVNVNRNWHSLGHNPGTDKIVVDRWVMGQFSNLLDMLKAVPEGVGETMLDHMTVLWANHMESGDTHGAIKLPWILAGKCNNFFKVGQSFPDMSASNNTHVMATICNAMGLNLTTFGDGAPLPALKA